jgi:hypothetical protein
MTEVLEKKGASFVRDLGEAARQNPLSAALIGMGVLWLLRGQAAEALAGSTRPDRMPEAAAGAFDATSSTQKSGAKSVAGNIASATEKLQSGATEALEGASRFGREQADTVAQYARSVPSTGADMIDSLRSNLSHIFEAQPLALGAIGLAIGAGIAAAAPSTKMEADYLGETSDSVKEKAKHFAAEQATRGATVAEEALNAAADEARKQGLTVEGAKSAAGEVSEKVARVVDAAGKGFSERIGSNFR